MIIFPLQIADKVTNNTMSKTVFRLASIFFACVDLHGAYKTICRISMHPYFNAPFHGLRGHVLFEAKSLYLTIPSSIETNFDGRYSLRNVLASLSNKGRTLKSLS